MLVRHYQYSLLCLSPMGAAFQMSVQYQQQTIQQYNEKLNNKAATNTPGDNKVQLNKMSNQAVINK